MEKVARINCKYCQGERRCSRKSPSHLLHFFLSLVTFGLWLIVWSFVTLAAQSKWNCDTCGGSISWESRQKPLTKGRILVMVLLLIPFFMLLALFK